MFCRFWWGISSHCCNANSIGFDFAYRKGYRFDKNDKTGLKISFANNPKQDKQNKKWFIILVSRESKFEHPIKLFFRNEQFISWIE